MYYIRLEGFYTDTHYWAEDGPGGYWTRRPDQAQLFETREQAQAEGERVIPQADDWVVSEMNVG